MDRKTQPHTRGTVSFNVSGRNLGLGGVVGENETESIRKIIFKTKLH